MAPREEENGHSERERICGKCTSKREGNGGRDASYGDATKNKDITSTDLVQNAVKSGGKVGLERKSQAMGGGRSPT